MAMVSSSPEWRLPLSDHLAYFQKFLSAQETKRHEGQRVLWKSESLKMDFLGFLLPLPPGKPECCPADPALS